MTLMLLWKMLYTYDLRTMITPAKVKHEVDAVRSSLSWRRSVYGADEVESMAVRVPTRQPDGSITMPRTHLLSGKIASAEDAAAAAAERESAGGNSMDDGSLGSALLEWCQAVVERYEVPVYDLTTCLADGRALCLLIHYYHPAILPTKSIKKTTAHLIDSCFEDATLDPFTETASTVSSDATHKALQGERRNYWTLKKACNGIGGIPFILSEFDSRNVPEEKTMVVFLGYLFARVVESSHQVRAAIRMQRFIRGKAHTFTKAKAAKAAAAAALAATSAAAADAMSVVSSVPEDLLLDGEGSVAGSDVGGTEEESAERALRKLQSVVVTVQMCSKKAGAMIARQVKSFQLRKNFLILRDAHRQQVAAAQLAAATEVADLAAAEAAAAAAAIEAAKVAEAVAVAVAQQQEKEKEPCAASEPLAQAVLTESAESIAAFEVEHIVENALNVQMQQALKKSLDSQLERERRSLLATELRIVHASKCRIKQAEALRLCEQQVLAEQARAASLRSQAEMELRAQQAESERAEKEAAQARMLAECQARAAAEQRLQEVEALRLREMEQAAAAESQKQLREAEWVTAQTQAAEQQRVREAAEALRLESEAAARLEVEQRAESERAARMAAEERMQQEIAARQALEAKLQAIEDARIAAELEAQRREQEAQELAAKLAAEAAALALQQEEEARVRALQLQEEAEALAVLRDCAAVVMQARWRCYSAVQRRHRTLRCVCAVQARVRGMVARREARCAMLAVLIVQGMWRRYQCAKVLQLRAACTVVIQSAWRMYVVQKELRSCAAAAMVLGASWRASVQRKVYVQFRCAVVSLQAGARRRSVVRQLLQMTAAATAIQSVVRMRRAVAQVHTLLQRIRAIQGAWRRAVVARRARLHSSAALRSERLLKMQRRRSSRIVGQFMRKCAASCKNAAAATSIARWYLHRCRPVLRAQALVRGFRRLAAVRRAVLIRRRISAKVTAMRLRIQAAEAKARADPSLRLGKQTVAALHTLQTGKMISALLKACQVLQLSTQVSRYCCEAFAQAEAASILFGLLRSCNRSQPHQELLRYTKIIMKQHTFLCFLSIIFYEI
jgi:abnormal spindle-like microcephaly-associated protein